MLPPHPDERQAAQTRSSKLVDLVVIGGGINGSGIAVDAAGRGLSVLLCEQHDLAAHTSSASSKLVHGGCATSNSLIFVWCVRRWASARC